MIKFSPHDDMLVVGRDPDAALIALGGLFLEMSFQSSFGFLHDSILIQRDPESRHLQKSSAASAAAKRPNQPGHWPFPKLPMGRARIGGVAVRASWSVIHETKSHFGERLRRRLI
jgi:hypothetical protein